jgi:hypothetical protein
VETLSDRIDAALNHASAANQKLQGAVEKARAAVADVGKQSADLSKGGEGKGAGEKGQRARRKLRTLLQQQVGPSIDDLGGRLATLSDAAVAVSSLLQSFEELLPARGRGRRGNINPEQMERWADMAQHLSASLRRLDSVVGDGEKAEGEGQEVVTAANQVDQILQRCQAKADSWQSDLDAARAKSQQVKAEILGWLTPVAIVVTLLFVGGAAGQISLFAHALAWCRGAGKGHKTRQDLCPP